MYMYALYNTACGNFVVTNAQIYFQSFVDFYLCLLNLNFQNQRFLFFLSTLTLLSCISFT